MFSPFLIGVNGCITIAAHAPPGSATPALARHAHRAGRSVPPPQESARGASGAVHHQLGWEVRLLIGSQVEVVQTQVCRDQEEVLTTGEQWKAAMIEKGWRDGS